LWWRFWVATSVTWFKPRLPCLLGYLKDKVFNTDPRIIDYFKGSIQ
jgi:hypothetical protein